MAEVTRKGHPEDSGLVGRPGSVLGVPVARTGLRGRHSDRVGSGPGVQGQPAGRGHRPGTLASGKFNLVTSTLAFFTALEGNPKLQDSKSHATAQIQQWVGVWGEQSLALHMSWLKALGRAPE